MEYISTAGDPVWLLSAGDDGCGGRYQMGNFYSQGATATNPKVHMEGPLAPVGYAAEDDFVRHQWEDRP